MKRWTSLFTVLGLAGLCGCSADMPAEKSPNILYIVADDLGYTDIGPFGSEIPTPNLDELAAEGVRLTNFHAADACQPSRVMMMASTAVSTALEIHGRPMSGIRGNLLSRNWAILPELLQDAGYAAYMTGKWDLGVGEGYTPATRGFDRSFALIDGSASHFSEEFWEDPFPYEDDGRRLSIDDLPQDFYSTDYYTDRMLEFLRSNDGETPWFAYVPYTTPHWPLQLPDEWLDRHTGRYDEGYDVLREARFARASELGVVPAGASLATFEPTAEPWSNLSPEQQRRQARAQEIYAGMVEHMDYSIGRIVDYLEESGQLDNTVIMFSSDHGASTSDWGLVPGDVGRTVTARDNRLENFGRRGSYIDHGRGFGEAASAPLKGTKGRLSEGGLRAAALIRYPAEINGGDVNGTFMTMMDILPTFLEIAGTQHPGASTYKGRQINDIVGRSFWPHLTGRSDTVHLPTDVAGWALGNVGAVIRGDFKLINQALPGGMAVSLWRLYNIAEDPGETRDLSGQYPELTAELAREWLQNWR
jgi:arylsulfatase